MKGSDIVRIRNADWYWSQRSYRFN